LKKDRSSSALQVLAFSVISGDEAQSFFRQHKSYYSKAVLPMQKSSSASVLMMDTADMRNGHDLSLGWRLNWSQYRALFIERQVRSRLVIVGDVGFQHLSQMPFIENDDVIQTLSPD
jgi:hypothetical protein